MDAYDTSFDSPYDPPSIELFTASDQYPLPSADIRSTPENFYFSPLRVCIAITRRGRACRMRPLRDADYCVSHDPRRNTERDAKRAWEASAIARRKPAELLESVLSLTDRVSIQAFLDIIIRLHLAGHLSEAQAKIALRAASIASQNFDRAHTSLLGPEPQVHEWGAYIDRVKDGLSSIEALFPPSPGAPETPETPEGDESE